MMSRVRGRGTLGRHLIHYILHRPFYKRALCWNGAGVLGGDSSQRSSWKDRWMEAAWTSGEKERDGTGTATVDSIQPAHSNVNFIIFIVNSTISKGLKAESSIFRLVTSVQLQRLRYIINKRSRKDTILEALTIYSHSLFFF